FSISTLIEPIREELHLSDSGIAFLTGVALAVFYVTVGIPIADLADRVSRRNILAIAIAVWSGMTALCGLAHSYWQLLLARFGVGIGEGGGTPPSTSMLADKFPPARRPMAHTIFALGACLGAWLGSQVAGEVAERSGWRAAFLVLGVPGPAVALAVALTVRQPRRGQLDHSPPAAPGTLAAPGGFVTALTTIPSIALYWVQSRELATVLLWVFVPAVYFYIGPILGLLQNVIPAGMRATACALLLFIANVANLVLAPQLIGWLSDWFA